MPLRNASYTLTYHARNTTTGCGVTGDAANHTLRLIRDGVSIAPINSPAEVDAVNAPGEYRIILTATEMQAATIKLVGISGTVSVVIEPVVITTQAMRHGQQDNYIIVPDATTDMGRGVNLRAAYATAKTLTPGGNALSATNRATVLVPSGRYDFGAGDMENHGLVLDAEFIDIIGTGDNRDDVLITSAIMVANRGTIEQTANDVLIKNIAIETTAYGYSGATDETRPGAYFPESGLTKARLENVHCIAYMGHGTSMRGSITYAGRYVDVLAELNGFGYGGTASGYFERCTNNGSHGFGGYYGGEASGTFIDCINTGVYGFGGYRTASGLFIRCINHGGYGFGGYGGTATGTFIDCIEWGNYGFAGGHHNSTSNASGLYIRCICHGYYGFGGFTRYSGTAIDCVSVGRGGFGGGGSGLFSGTIKNCSVLDACDVSYNCDGATIDSCYFRSTGSVPLFKLLSDGVAITNTTIEQPTTSTQPPVVSSDGTARSVVFSGNRCFSPAAYPDGLGENVINIAATDTQLHTIAADAFATKTMADMVSIEDGRVLSTVRGETVTTDTESREASKADVSAVTLAAEQPNYTPATTADLTDTELVDGMPLTKAAATMLAVLAGKTTSNGGTVEYKLQDGATTAATITYGQRDGERTSSTIE